MVGVEAPKPVLHSLTYSRRTIANRAFAVVYACGIFALLYRHVTKILNPGSFLSLFISLSLFVSDAILGFMWFTTQSFRMKPAYRKVFPENLQKVVQKKDFPAIDIFICTADPYKEPPLNTVNTALSVMAYDYPPEKLSIYVSDDGGSALTLFAFMEAAKFGRHWLPFCRRNDIGQRSPEAFFRSNHQPNSETDQVKILYESMKFKLEHTAETGKIPDEYLTSQQEHDVFQKWKSDFTRQDHPSIIQVLLEKGKDKDITEQSMPNLIYVSREKSKASWHNFKGGALNTLLRVSGVMTNGPIILTLDCDTISNDPRTPRNVLCYFFSTNVKPTLGYVQFPQRFKALNKNDIYACEFKRLYVTNPEGMDGLGGPCYVGTGCFFSRRSFFGGPSSFVEPDIPQLHPDHKPNKPIGSPSVLALAERVSNCNYENQTNWGSKLGFSYGSTSEDFNTGYRMHCEGWKSVFCNPNNPAFLGDCPISLNDLLTQTKRWATGLLEVAFSKRSPVTFGCWALGPVMGFSYAHNAFWPIWAIPITVYAFLPQIALVNGVSIFPEVSDVWFKLYIFLVGSAYGQDCLDFMLDDGTFQRWWSDQRMWMVRGVTSYTFGLIEHVFKCLGISAQVFNLTSKVVDEDQSKRYEQGTLEFGVESPMFISLGTVGIVNLIAFVGGLIRILRGSNDSSEGQMMVVAFVLLNCWPIYEAMVLRTDKGRIQTKTTITSIFLASFLYMFGSFAIWNILM